MVMVLLFALEKKKAPRALSGSGAFWNVLEGERLLKFRISWDVKFSGSRNERFFLQAVVMIGVSFIFLGCDRMFGHQHKQPGVSTFACLAASAHKLPPVPKYGFVADS
jgi:hypothetical protein